MQKGNQQYELTFILDEKAGAEQGTAKAAQLAKFVKEQEGAVVKEEHWGRRELAYEINHNRSGFYVTMWLELPAPALKLLDRELRLDSEVIRYLATKAYTTAQPGSLYPVVEEEKPERGAHKEEEATTAEEMLRRTAAVKPSKKAAKEVAAEAAEDALPEEERLKKLDDTLEELLKDEEA